MPGHGEVRQLRPRQDPRGWRVRVKPVPRSSLPCPGVKNPALAKFGNGYQGIDDEGASLCRDATQGGRLEPSHFPGVDQPCGAFIPARHGSSINSGWGRPPEAMREMTRFSGGQGQGGAHDLVRQDDEGFTLIFSQGRRMIRFEVWRWKNAKGGMRYAFPPYGLRAINRQLVSFVTM